METDTMLLSALKAIPVSDLTREEWIQIGMALKDGGQPVSVWDSWSMADERYKPGECERLWEGFRGSAKPVKNGSIIKMAEQRYGWSRYGDTDGALDWNAEIGRDADQPEIVIDHMDLSPADELQTYLELLFKPDEYVSYVTTDTYQSEDGKWMPTAGVYTRTAGELIKELKKYKIKGKDISYTIGTWKEEAGAWIRFNALDGHGVKNENVVSFRHALVESDTMSLEDQERLYRELQLPIVAMVASGGKSIHAIVRVDAQDFEQYRQRVDKLYDVLKAHGVEVDKQNKNPSRLSRMPGVTRNGHRQQLLATNIGKRSWAEWEDYIDGFNDNMPSFITLSDYYDNPPELPPALIEGVLRCGHKMLISGTAKAGKSFLIAELCIAIASGTKWLGMQCQKGKVLYVNLEIDDNSCIRRYLNIANKMGIDKSALDNIKIWNIRGKALPLDQLIPHLIRRIRNEQFSAIVIDPIYKVITGDENNASEMGYFCNQFDRICAEAKCAAIYCHHHSKGAQGQKRAMDRASGSGVFSRDPDAQLDMIQLELNDDLKNNVAEPGATAWRIESTLREFPDITPLNVWFEYPIHRIDTSGELAKLFADGDPRRNLERKSTPESRLSALERGFREAGMGAAAVDLDALSAAIGINSETVRRHIKEFPEHFICDRGMVRRSEN